MLQYGREVLGDFEKALRYEWLEANGVGGFASSSILGINTRRYHGLLLASLKPPVARFLLLSKYEEELVVGEQRFALSANLYPGVVHPDGFRWLTEVRLDPYPVFRYEVAGAVLEKRVFLVQGESTVVVQWELLQRPSKARQSPVATLMNEEPWPLSLSATEKRACSSEAQRPSGTALDSTGTAESAVLGGQNLRGCLEAQGPPGTAPDSTGTTESAVPGGQNLRGPWQECRLLVRPLLAFRDYHSVTHANDAINKELRTENGAVVVQPYDGLPALRFASNALTIAPVGEWYREFQYPREKERGLEWEEDLFCPFEAAFDLNAAASMVASTQFRGAAYADHLRQVEEARRVWHGEDDFDRLLNRAAGQFIASRPGKTILAGYPWFTDWGRDTMVSLPGLTLATGQNQVAKSILQGWAAFADGGMLPNRFPDSGEAPEYNTVDAALWYFEAVAKYLDATNDFDTVRRAIYPALKQIVDGYRAGTRFGIHADTDGLVVSGPQLTWMDGVVDGKPMTPREGKAVEIQALWYNALQILGGLANRFEEKELADELEGLARTVCDSFHAKFWNESTGCFFDLIGDSSVRPNQLLALSLTHSLASPDQAAKVLEVVGRELLTPYGLRTLSPADPRYKGRYEGPPAQRDAAYHQGTVWPWLLGPYCAAARRFGIETVDVWRGLREYAFGPGCGQIPEIFDGDAPYEPRGCTAQAWSVGEALRCLSLNRLKQAETVVDPSSA